MAKNCTHCNEVLDDDMLFCIKCGTKQPVVKKCANCGNQLAEAAEFCTECGSKVSPIDKGFDLNEMSLKQYKKYIYIVLGIVVFIGMLMAFNSGNSETANSKNEKTVVQTVKAEDLVDDYIRDYSSAESKYKGSKIKVTGKVVNKGQFNNTNNFYVTLYSTSAAGKDYTLMVDIPAENVSDVNRVKHSDFITVEGTCRGSVPQKNATDISIQIGDAKINQ